MAFSSGQPFLFITSGFLADRLNGVSRLADTLRQDAAPCSKTEAAFNHRAVEIDIEQKSIVAVIDADMAPTGCR